MCKVGKNVREVTCQYCHGKGEVLNGVDDMYGVVSTWMEECSCCEGTGVLIVSDKTCIACGVEFTGEDWQEECDDCYRERLLDELEDLKSEGKTH